jgi:hypothetical protein
MGRTHGKKNDGSDDRRFDRRGRSRALGETGALIMSCNHSYLEHYRGGSDLPSAFVCRHCGFLIDADSPIAELAQLDIGEYERLMENHDRAGYVSWTALEPRDYTPAPAVDGHVPGEPYDLLAPRESTYRPDGAPLDFDLTGKRTAVFSGDLAQSRAEGMEPATVEHPMKQQKSGSGRWWGRSVIYGKEDEATTPYMTRYWIGRLRLHDFHRGDQDPDHHDHPWRFWTFPLVPYVEEVVLREYNPDTGFMSPSEVYKQVVPAFRLTYRPATHTHRVLGRFTGEIKNRWTPGEDGGKGWTHAEPQFDEGRVVTIVWRSKEFREWGFLKNRDGKWCWVAWKEYVFGDGKSAPCE